jgi:glycosyltransferase involved in cell wall biosynthesis
VKILIGVHQFFPEFYAGTERYALNIAKYLKKLGHSVKVFTYGLTDDGYSQGINKNILIKKYEYENIPVIAVKHKKPIDYTFNLEEPNLFEEALYFMSREKFDIFHCAHPYRIYASLKAASSLGIKTVLMLTDYWLICPLGIMLRADNTICSGPDYGRKCVKYCFTAKSLTDMGKRIKHVEMLLNCVDVVLSPSKFLIKMFSINKAISSDRFKLSRHGFDYSKKKRHNFNKKESPLTFGFIGTIQYHKGVHVLVEAFRKIKTDNIKLKIWGGDFGDRLYFEKIKKMAAKDKRIEMLGQYDFNDIEDVLGDIDVIVVPSIWYENAPLTITTSHAYGIPVIASDVGGMAEMVEDGVNGLTFKVGDASDLAKKISMFIEDSSLINKFSQNIQYPIRLEEEVLNMQRLYEDLLK